MENIINTTIEEVLSAAKKNLVSEKFYHKPYKRDFEIIDIKNVKTSDFKSNEFLDVTLIVEDDLVFSLRVLLKNRIAEFHNEDSIKTFMDYLNKASEDCYTVLKQEEIAKAEKEKEEAERLKKEEETKKKEAALKKYNENLIKKLEVYKPEITGNFYTCLGWLAKHCKKIIAKMPDTMENWFVSKFGNVEHTTVDSKKRTVNGNPMQWTLSMEATVDDTKNLYTYFSEHLDSSNKKIASTELLFSLVMDYGFEIGKKQDVEKIKYYIPESEMDNFEIGYNN